MLDQLSLTSLYGVSCIPESSFIAPSSLMFGVMLRKAGHPIENMPWGNEHSEISLEAIHIGIRAWLAS